MNPSHGRGVAHMVFFTLADKTEPHVASLVSDCYAYLQKIPGVQYLAAGPRGVEFTRPVNDNAFDVALLVVYTDKAAHDGYQTHPDHLFFVDKHKPNWTQVRVFDAWV